MTGTLRYLRRVLHLYRLARWCFPARDWSRRDCWRWAKDGAND